MKKKPVIAENYLERIPCRPDAIAWSVNEDGKVILEIENKGVFHRIAQILLKKPRISYIHLDEMGSFVWPLMDGETTIIALGEAVEQRFGETAHPLYERLIQYLRILESYQFLYWK